MFFNLTGAENSTIASLGRVTRFGLLDFAAERAAFSGIARDLGIRKRATSMSVGELSGGNQQKIVLARWIFGAAELFLLDEPTQGIDVGAKASLYQLLRDLTRRGNAIVLVSSDLEELLAMSDRIAILRTGVLTQIQPACEFDERTLSIAMSGGTVDRHNAQATRGF